MIFIVMGAAGSGKTTIGNLLAKKLGISFYDADDFHPAANIEKMQSGTPLDDTDRKPWLDALHGLIQEHATNNEPIVLACSALRRSHRDTLSAGLSETYFIYLRGTHDELAGRLAHRKDHFMKLPMLESQLATLEEPEDALVTVSIVDSPETQIAEIVQAIQNRAIQIPAF